MAVTRLEREADNRRQSELAVAEVLHALLLVHGDGTLGNVRVARFHSQRHMALLMEAALGWNPGWRVA